METADKNPTHNIKAEFTNLNLAETNLEDVFTINLLKSEKLDLEEDAELTKNLTLEDISRDILEIEKDIQKLYYILVMEQIKDYSYPVYVPYYYDFRGRMYPRSVLGFTYLKLIRPFFKLNFIISSAVELEILSSSYYKQLMSQPVELGDLFDEQKDRPLKKYYLIVLLLEIGKL